VQRFKLFRYLVDLIFQFFFQRFLQFAELAADGDTTFYPAKNPIIYRTDTMIAPDTLRFRHRVIPGLNQVR